MPGFHLFWWRLMSLGLLARSRLQVWSHAHSVGEKRLSKISMFILLYWRHKVSRWVFDMWYQPRGSSGSWWHSTLTEIGFSISADDDDPCLRSLPTADDNVYSFTSTAFQPCCSGAFRAPRTWISPSQAGHPHAHSYRLQFLSPAVLLPFFSNWGETRAHQKQEWLCLVTFLWSRYH